MQINPLSWILPWDPSMLVSLVTIITAILYIRGGKNCFTPPWQQLIFWLGFITLYIASHTRLDYYFEHAFFLHRIQHTLLHHIGPFLIALSRPGTTLAYGLPQRWRSVLNNWLNNKSLVLIINIINHPVSAVLVFCSLIGLWLIPSIHFVAMLDWRLYRLMNWSMAINGLMFWNLMLNNYCIRPAQISAMGRIVCMLAIVPPQIIIGLLLFTARSELYPIYSLCGRAIALSPLADQQLGGMVLWISAAMMSVIGILIVFVREWKKTTILSEGAARI